MTTILKTIQTFAVDRRYNRVLWSHHICWKTPTCQIYEGIDKWHTQNYLNEKYSRSIKQKISNPSQAPSVILKCVLKSLWNKNSPACMRSRSSNWALAIISPLRAIMLIKEVCNGGVACSLFKLGSLEKTVIDSLFHSGLHSSSPFLSKKTHYMTFCLRSW